MEPLAVQIEKAVVQLYGDPSNNDVTTAEKWLISIQESKEVWSVAWQLLERDRVEVQNFGAILLKNKLLKSWNEVPENQYESLRFQIFQSIMKFSENGRPKMVLTQLCVAMVRYVFHSMPTVWPNAIVSVVHTLNSSQAQANLSGLLELLKVLPEEFEASNDNAFAGKRAIIRSEINKSQSTVFGFLEQILLSNSSLNIKLSALKCLTSWSGGFVPLLPELRSLVSLLFQLLHDQQLVNDSIEVLTSLITNEDCYKYPTSVKEFQLLLNSKSDFIQTLLNDTDRDNDLCSMMCVLVTETSVTCVKSLTADINQETTENCEESLETLTLLLRFTTLPGHYPTDEKCSEITFCFWERFLGEIESEEVSKQEFLLEFYEGILVSLIEIFPIKARYPSEEEWVESWSEDEQDEFMRYRDELWDLGESIQLTMHYQFVHHLSLTLSNLFSGQSPPLWQDVEAILFLLQVSAGSINEDTSVFFQSTLSLFPRMPSNNTLAKSALRLLGELAEWFRDCPDVLMAILPMILDNLSKPTLTASAALAFRDICGDCHKVLANSDISSIVLSCQVAFSNPGVSSDQCAIMIAAVGLILSSLPLSSLSQPLDILLHSRIESIQTLANGQPSMQTHPLVMKELTILNSFCLHVSPSVQEGEQHPVLTVLIRLWPSLKELLGKWMGDSEVISIISSCLSRAIRTVHLQFLPLLTDTLHLILQCFSTVHYPKLLDTTSELVKHFGQLEECHNLLLPYLSQILTLCCQLCTRGLQSMDPDTVQSFLGLLGHIIETCPVLMVKMEGMANNTFNICLASLQLPEQQSMSSASSLMVSIIKRIPTLDFVREIISAQGLSLVEFILRGVAGGVDRSRLDLLVNILHQLSIQCVTELSTWLQVLLSKQGFPTVQASSLEKQVFMQSVLRARGDKEALKHKVSEFSLICRGFHGTIYAIETSRSLP